MSGGSPLASGRCLVKKVKNPDKQNQAEDHRDQGQKHQNVWGRVWGRIFPEFSAELNGTSLVGYFSDRGPFAGAG